MYRLLIAVLLCFFVSCNKKLIEKPEALIPKDKMVTILYDLAILTAAQNTNPAMLAEKDIKTMEFLYTKHGIDSIQFAQSDLYYASLPVEYEAIYKEIVALLEKDQKTIEEIRTKAPDDTKNKSGKPVKTIK